MTLDSHALSSIASTLEELTSRISTIIDGISDTEEEALSELAEIERQLTTTMRRLDKVVHRHG